jgi:hypothetical protein
MKATTRQFNKSKNLELVKFQSPNNLDELKKTHLPFSGSLRQHPYDDNKVVLLSEPYANNTIYYEFNNDDIGFAEKLANIVNSDGEDVTMAMLWIKKGSVGVRNMPFFVESVSH